MNSPTPIPPSFNTLLKSYQATLNSLDNNQEKLKKEQALAILMARDTLQKQLEQLTDISIEIFTELMAEDQRLKHNAYKLTEVLNLSEYRESLLISDQAWWWYLDSRESSHPWNRWDWLAKTLKLILLGVNFTLIGAISTRFLGSGSGLVEIGGVIFSTFISLLQTQNALTQARQK